ncbi:MAG: hypothetical protein ACRELC_14750 [Gemmatimonadota bacterium]
MSGRGGRPPVAALIAACAALGGWGCWRTGEATPGPARVTWAAYPESARAGETFSFEFAGPVSPTACGRLDTAILAVEDGAIRLSARRSTFRAVCANQRISFYEARALSIRRPGRYAVTTAQGLDLGTLVVTDSAPFTRIRALGLGTVREVAGCRLFGPGWIGNQRVFALSGAPEAVRREAGSDRVVHVDGTVVGFTLCGWYGSRPTIRVDTAWATERRASDWYRGDA